MNIAETLSYEFIKREQTVFNQGDKGDKFYIIIEGEVSIKIFNKVYDAKKKDLHQVQVLVKRLQRAHADVQERIDKYSEALQEVPEALQQELRDLKGELEDKQAIMNGIQSQLD